MPWRAPRPAYTWPTGGPAAVLEGFDPPAVVWGSGHRGVDLALAAGSPVLAAGDGTVVFAGMVAGRPVVSIDHADGMTRAATIAAGVLSRVKPKPKPWRTKIVRPTTRPSSLVHGTAQLPPTRRCRPR